MLFFEKLTNLKSKWFPGGLSTTRGRDWAGSPNPEILDPIHINSLSKMFWVWLGSKTQGRAQNADPKPGGRKTHKNPPVHDCIIFHPGRKSFGKYKISRFSGLLPIFWMSRNFSIFQILNVRCLFYSIYSLNLSLCWDVRKSHCFRDSGIVQDCFGIVSRNMYKKILKKKSYEIFDFFYSSPTSCSIWRSAQHMQQKLIQQSFL